MILMPWNYTVPIAVLCPAQHGGEAANLCRTNTLTPWQSYIGRYSHPLDSDSEGSFWYYGSSTYFAICIASWLLPVSFVSLKGNWRRTAASTAAIVKKRHVIRLALVCHDPVSTSGHYQLSWVPHHFGLQRACYLVHSKPQLSSLFLIRSETPQAGRKMSKPSFPLLSTMLSTNLVGCCTPLTKR